MSKLLRIICLVLIGPLTLPSSASPQPFSLSRTIRAQSTNDLHLFGLAVSIDGDRALITAPEEPVDPEGMGVAYIFERAGGGSAPWVQRARLDRGAVVLDDDFGCSAALSASVAVVGAPSAVFGTGEVHIFLQNEGGPGQWGLAQTIEAPDPKRADFFGNAVSISGATLVVGAANAEDRTGIVYVFERSSSSGEWEFASVIEPAERIERAVFGVSVAVSGSVLVVGAPNRRLEMDGSVHIFSRDTGDPTTWTQVQQWRSSDLGASELFGWDVDLSGDHVIAGSPNRLGLTAFSECFTPIDTSGGGDEASAHVFLRDAGGSNNWGRVKRIDDSDLPSASSEMGSSVGIIDRFLVVGDPATDGGDGRAWVFERSGQGWFFLRVLTPATSRARRFGHSVDISAGAALASEVAIVGVPEDEERGPRSGAANLFVGSITFVSPLVPVLGPTGILILVALLALFATWHLRRHSAGAAAE